MQLDFSEVLFPQYVGVVYALRLVPEAAPLRLKVGWSTSFQARLGIHRVTNPTLEVLWTGPCVTQLAERRCRDFTGAVATLVGGKEVFDFACERDLRAALAVFQLIVNEFNAPWRDWSLPREPSPLVGDQPLHFHSCGQCGTAFRSVRRRAYFCSEPCAEEAGRLADKQAIAAYRRFEHTLERF